MNDKFALTGIEDIRLEAGVVDVRARARTGECRFAHANDTPDQYQREVAYCAWNLSETRSDARRCIWVSAKHNDMQVTHFVSSDLDMANLRKLKQNRRGPTGVARMRAHFAMLNLLRQLCDDCVGKVVQISFTKSRNACAFGFFKQILSIDHAENNPSASEEHAEANAVKKLGH